jgi:hypothetical protein
MVFGTTIVNDTRWYQLLGKKLDIEKNLLFGIIND